MKGRDCGGERESGAEHVAEPFTGARRALRCLHVDSARGFSGGQRQVLNLALGLRQRGHSVALVCPEGSALRRRADAEGLECFRARMAHPLDLASAARLAGLVRNWRPDIVHLHTATAHSIGCWASVILRLQAGVRAGREGPAELYPATREPEEVARRARHSGDAGRPPWVPAFVAAKRTDFSPRPGRLTQLRYSRLVDRVTAVSGAARQALIQAGIPPHKIEVIYSSVDCDHFRPDCAPDLRRQLGIPIDALVVGVVGHLTPRKGQRFLLQAAPAILERIPRACFLFCGEGESRQRLEQMAAALGASERVRFLGFMSDVRPVLQSLDVFVLPSEREALGVALLEAMAMGKPVVASCVGGIAEAVQHQQTGLLVPPADVEALSEALVTLLLDPAMRKRMGEQARLRAQGMFCLPAMVERTEELYLQILLSRAPPASGPHLPGHSRGPLAA